MSDTYRRYRAIKQGVLQFYQPRPSGHQARQLDTLVALTCGLAGGRHANLATIADHAPSHRADQESIITRFRHILKKTPSPPGAGSCPEPRRCSPLSLSSRSR